MLYLQFINQPAAIVQLCPNYLGLACGRSGCLQKYNCFYGKLLTTASLLIQMFNLWEFTCALNANAVSSPNGKLQVIFSSPVRRLQPSGHPYLILDCALKVDQPEQEYSVQCLFSIRNACMVYSIWPLSVIVCGSYGLLGIWLN